MKRKILLACAGVTLGAVLAQAQTVLPIPAQNPTVPTTITLTQGQYVAPVGAAFTVPANVTLRVNPGAIIRTEGKTITFNGSIEAGAYQIFDGGGTVRITTVPPHGIPPQWWGCKTDVTRDCTASISAAASAASAGQSKVHFSPGNYLVTDEIVFPLDRVQIEGEGQHSSIIVFHPTVAGKAAFHFKKAAATTVVQWKVSGLGFDAAGNTTNTKTAIRVTDGEELILDDVSVGNWSSTAKDSIGFQFRGRQMHSVTHVTVNADNPISIEANPNSYLSSDHYHFADLYLTADTSQPCIKMADAITVQNFTIDGYNSCNLGNRALYWNSTTDVNASINITISNLRWEQSTSGLHGIYITRAAPIYGLVINNTRMGNLADVKGIYLRNIRGGNVKANVFGGTIEALNIDVTDQAMVFEGNNWTPGGAATVAATGWVDGVWVGNNQGAAAAIGVGVVNPSGAIVTRNNVNSISAQNAAGNAEIPIAKVGTNGHVLLSPGGALAYIMAPLAIGGELAASSEVAIANGLAYGVQNAAGTDTVSVATVDGSNNVVIAPAGGPTLVGGTLSAAGGFKYAGAATSGLYLKGNGTVFLPSGGPASGTGTPTPCTNQFVTGMVLNSDAAPTTTCTTATLAGAQFANQGTTTTVLHGNGAGNPSFGSVVNNDIAAATIDLTAKVTGALPIANGGTGAATFAARTVLANATSATAAPAAGTTVDALAYQTAEIPHIVFVTSNFTTSGVGTALEAITGLTWTFPANTALNLPFHCALTYHQNSGLAAVAFGFQDASVAPTNLSAQATMTVSATTATATVTGNVVASSTTTATAIATATPSAITTNWTATIDGLVEQPSNGSSSVFTIRVSTATTGDTVTVNRGGFCTVG